MSSRLGLESKLDTNWSVGLEGLYYHIHKEFQKYVNTLPDSDYTVSKLATKREEDNNALVVRARLTYHVN